MSTRTQTPPTRRGRPPGPARAFAASLLAVALVAAGGSIASAADAPTASVPLDATDGHYIVTLRDQPAASYDGTLDGLPRTQVDPGSRLDAESDQVQKYSAHLGDLHRQTADAVGATITNDYSVTTDGFSAELTTDQVRRLATDPDVLSVEKDVELHPESTPSIRALGLDGAGGVWAKTGGQDHAGAGAVIGDIDSGITPDSPSFAGSPLGTKPGADPYRSGSGIVFRKGDGTLFHGVCQTGDGFTASDCSTKIVGARYFVAGRDAATDKPIGPQEKRSPFDANDHGTHTASTAAGDAGVSATVAGRVLDTISGVAPAAKVAAYKVCWSGPDPKVETDDGCEGSDIVAAIEQATKDGVDVINMSLGGSQDDQATKRALLGAASAGIFVAASAGNEGPGASTLSNTEPWVTTVAASSVPDNYSATATFGDGRKVAGASVSVVAKVTGSLVLASASGASGASSPNLCGANTLDPAKVTGKIVVCERGVVNRVDKSAEVLRAGGIGMLLVNPTSNSTDLDTHSVPTIHLDADVYQEVVDYAGKAGATVTLAPGNSSGVQPAAPQIAGFSSRGPKQDEGSDIVKPDIAAPGVGIVASVADKDGKPAFAVESGTSMSAPHIAGLALLYLGVHPKASPAEIKSAMMTTASDTVDTKGATVTDPFAQGAGEVVPSRFLDPGLLYLSGEKDWRGYAAATGLDLPHPSQPVAASQLNLPSIAVAQLLGSETVTRTVTSTKAGTWKASVQGVSGVDVQVAPSTLSFTGPGQTKSFQVRLTTHAGAKTGSWTTGSLTWSGPGGTVRGPIAVTPESVQVPATASGSGVSGTTGVTVTGGIDGTVALTAAGLAKGEHVSDPDDAGAAHSGEAPTGYEVDYPLTLTNATKALVIDIAPADGKSDMGVALLKKAKTGPPTVVADQETASLGERLVASDLEAGDYTVAALVNQAAGSAKTAAFDLTEYQVGSGAGEGSLAVTPSALRTKPGKPASYTASWSGLAAGSSYVGVVSYGGSDATTLLSVSTAAASPPPVATAPTASAPPAITGTPDVGQTLTASTGTWTPEGVTLATQWLSNGTPIAGATGSTFRVTSAVAGTALAIRVTATASDGQTGVATSPTVTARDAATVHMQATQPRGAASGTVHVQVSVTSAGKQAATGVVRVTVDGAEHDVPLDGSGSGCADIAGIAPGTRTVQASYAGDNLVGGGTSRAQRILVR
ncbi:S8 family serine peptidase [Clavibacter michiganensis]|uniref:S8 family serine peptidase n=1 Tax=Clavibacter michiganensis TaxID=28447 RepID=UPI003EC0BE25